jgi:hypothetical protein
MCIICVDFARGALKLGEARRALGELRAKVGEEHAAEVDRLLDLAEEDEGPPTSPNGTLPNP